MGLYTRLYSIRGQVSGTTDQRLDESRYAAYLHYTPVLGLLGLLRYLQWKFQLNPLREHNEKKKNKAYVGHAPKKEIYFLIDSIWFSL